MASFTHLLFLNNHSTTNLPTFLTPNPGKRGLEEGCDATRVARDGQYDITLHWPACNKQGLNQSTACIRHPNHINQLISWITFH